MKKAFLSVLLVLFFAANSWATIVYSDYATGNDSTGDGSYSNPYKTIARADNGLTGGDEVRVAKTAMRTLSGTLTFTEGSTTVNTTADLTGELTAGDVISKNTGPSNGEGWWRVASLTSSAITLSLSYYGESGSGVTGYAMTPTSASATDGEQTSGTSSDQLVISGGWDLSTQTRDGLTCTLCTSTFANNISIAGSYVSMSYFVLLLTGDSSDAIYISGNYASLSNIYVAGTSDYGSIHPVGEFCTIADSVLTGPGDADGIYAQSSFYLTIDGVYIYSTSVGVKFYDMAAANIVDSTIRSCTQGVYTFIARGILASDCYISNATYGVYIYSICSKIKIMDVEIASCTNGIYSNDPVDGVLAKNITFTSCTNNYVSTEPYMPIFYASSTEQYTLYQYLKIGKDTTDARSGSCVKFSPTHATSIPVSAIGTFKVSSAASDITLSIYIKDDAGFNGYVVLYADCGGKAVTDYVEVTPTTSYAEQQITISSADLTVDEYVTLYIVVSGTAGSVYIDDFSYSQGS